MKRLNTTVFSLKRFATIVLLLASVSTAAAAHRTASGSGRLIIHRSPDLGNLVYAELTIDGYRITGIGYNQNYDRLIPAGRHLVKIQLTPAQFSYLPSSMNLEVRPGHTYAFVAAKRGGALVLIRV